MEIKDVKCYLVNSGFRNLIFIRVHTDEEIVGVGEGGAAYGVGSLAVKSAIEELKPLLIGQDPFEISRICQMMYAKSFWGLSHDPIISSVISGVEQALWDIKGKMLKVPVYELLGGKIRDKIRVYVNAYEIAQCKPEEYASYALKVVEDGFNAVKIYPFGNSEIALNDNEVIERVKAVRDAVGDELALMIDGGWKYSLSTHAAIRIGKKLERFDPFFYEEPIAPGNIEAMRKVKKNVDIPIAAGERIYSRYEFMKYIENDALDIPQPDVGLVGGILELKKIADIADMYFVPIAPHNCNGPVATASTIQVDACIKNFLIQEIFPYELPWHYELVNAAFERRIKNGFIEVPDKPGIGVELDEEVIFKHPYKPLLSYGQYNH